MPSNLNWFIFSHNTHYFASLDCALKKNASIHISISTLQSQFALNFSSCYDSRENQVEGEID